MTTHGKVRVSFLDKMLKQYHPGVNPADVVQQFRDYYQKLERKDIERGRERKYSYLSSVQSLLSLYKKRVDADPTFKSQIHLTRAETDSLMNERKQNLRIHSIDIPSINGDAIVIDCRSKLQHPDFAMKVIAVACLTGRRMTEIISTCDFQEPETSHITPLHHPRVLNYWCCVKGLLKQRGENICFDVPLFAPRHEIVAAVESLRNQSGYLPQKNVNAVCSKKIARAMKRFCPQLTRIHEFRKFYVFMCFQYFNERHCSLPRLASDYLGHKTLSETVLTYLNFRVETNGTLPFP